MRGRPWFHRHRIRSRGTIGLSGSVDAVVGSSGKLSATLALAGSVDAVVGAAGRVSLASLVLSGSVDAVVGASALLLLLENEMLDYDGATNGLFTHLGKCVKHYNLQRTDGRDLDGDALEILEAFQAGDKDLIVEGLSTQSEDWKSEHIGRRAYLVGLSEERLQHREDVLEQIGATSADIDEILLKLHKQMITDGETIKRSTVTIGNLQTVSPANTGNGRILMTTKLDGVTSPGRGPAGIYLACPEYRGKSSELAVTSETMTLECITDAGVDGITAGTETFSWTGGVEHTLHGMEDNEGSGDIAEFQVANAAALLKNLDFEDAETANTPDDWTIVSGAAGTEIFVDATNFYHGAKSLKITSTGGNHALKQAVSGIGSAVDAKQGFVVSLWLKADASVSAGEFICRFEGTGYTAAVGTVEVQDVAISGTPTGGTYTLSFRGKPTSALAYNATSADVQAALRAIPGLECVVVTTQAGAPPDVTHRVTMHGVWGDPPALVATSSLTGGTPTITVTEVTKGVDSEEIRIPYNALPTGWTLLHFFIIMPATMPSDLALFVRSASITSGKSVWVDDVAFDKIQYGGGIGVAIIRGSTPFVRGDSFEFPVTNDNAGVFQTFFRRAFGFQLPSAAAPTISDTLATA